MKENEKNSTIVEIDDVDREIINLFNQDGRMSYRKIAKRWSFHWKVHIVGSSQKRWIRNSPSHDHSKLGSIDTLSRRVKGGVLENWEDRTAYHKNVLCMYDVTGEFDAILVARFKDTSELDQFIKGLLKEPDVQRTYTQTVLNIVKEDLSSSKML